MTRDEKIKEIKKIEMTKEIETTMEIRRLSRLRRPLSSSVPLHPLFPFISYSSVPLYLFHLLFLFILCSSLSFLLEAKK